MSEGVTSSYLTASEHPGSEQEIAENSRNYSSCDNNSSQGGMAENSTSEPGDVNATFQFALCVYQIVLCILIMGGSMLTMAAISCTKSLQTVQNKYINSLSVADQLVGSTLMQMIIKYYFVGMDECITWKTISVLLNTSISASLLAMLSIAIDRYIYIVHPFVHKRHVTAGRTNFNIIASWCMAVMYGLMPITGISQINWQDCHSFNVLLVQAKSIAYANTFLYFFICFGIGLTYSLIAKVAKEHIDRRNIRIQGREAFLRKQLPARISLTKTKKGTDVEAAVVKSESFVSDSSKFCSGVTTEGEPWQNDHVATPATHNVSKGDEVVSSFVVSDAESPVQAVSSIVQTELLDVKGTNSEAINPAGDGAHKASPVGSKHNLQTICSSESQSETPFCVEVGHQMTLRDQNEARLNTMPANDQARRGNLTIALSQQKDQCTSDKNHPPIPWSVTSLRWMKQMVIVFGFFLVCWTPCMVCYLVSCNYTLSYEVTSILSMFGISNSAVNFFVYSLYNKQFRVAIRNILRFRVKRKN